MIHFSVFGGHEGQLHPERGLYVAIFGGSTLLRPTLASRLVELRANPDVAGRIRGYFFFSLFGGITVKWPTLASEYLALRDAILGGALTLNDWDRLVARFGESGGLRAGSFALFGSVEMDQLPGEDAELDDLSMQRHLGALPDFVVDRLMLAVGHGGPQRLAAVRHAVAESLHAAAGRAAPESHGAPA